MGRALKLKRFIASMLVFVLMFTGIQWNFVVSAAGEEPYIKKELTEYRSEYTKTYLKSNGELESVVSSHALHFRNEKGEWEEIDQSLVLKEKDGIEVYETKNSPLTVSFPAETDSSNAVTISAGGHNISIELLENKKSKAEKKENKNNSKKSDRPKSKMIASEIMEQDLVTTSAIEYPDVYDNTDIRYDVTAGALKESVIIKEQPKGNTTYKYNIKADGLEAELLDNGQIEFYESGNKAEPVFTMPAPLMFDSENEYSYDIEVKLKNKKGAYELSYTPSKEWLRDESRAYPVTLDPSFVVSSGIEDSYTYSAEAHRNDYYGFEQQLKVGKSGWESTNPDGDTFDTYIQFKELPQIPHEEFTIDNAYLMVTPKSSVGNWNEIEVGAYLVTESWTNVWTNHFETAFNYYNRPASDDLVLATATFLRDFSGTNEGFTISQYVKGWYDNPETNHGVRLSLTKEPDSIWDSIAFYSSRTENSPYLSITYTPYVSATGITITNRIAGDKLAIGFFEPVYNFTAEVYPENATDKEIIWESSDPKVGSIDKYGTFTPDTLGKTTITASLASNPEIFDSFELTVYNIPVENLLITDKPENNQLNKNETYELKISATPDNATDISIINSVVRWSSSKPSVATVENGVLYANSPGTTTITASYDGAEASFVLTVPYIPISSLYYANMPPDFTLRVGETWTFSTISFPENASDPKITCTSSNPQVASVNGKTITANGVGTTNICITADDNPEVFAIEEITVLSGEIIINKPEYDTITVGTSWQLVNDENVLIRTNKPDVVTIGQNGWITANKSGKVVFELYNQYNPGGFIRYELVISGNVVITGVGSSITMSEGDIQEGLGAYISDGDNVPITWTSSNPDVAEIIVDPVRGTRLFANSAGTTTITAHALDIHSSASFTVYVNKAAVDLIVLYPSINLEDNILYIGETGYITAKNFPYLISVPYTWHLSNNQSIEVIERSSSRVEINPIAEGSTEVWASYYDIVSDPQTVIVKTPKSSIAKSPNAHYMSIGSTFTMRVNSDPGYADVEWNSQNKNVADFDGNVLSAKGTGTTTITATISVGTYVKNISFTLTVGRVTISGPANGELFVGGSRNLSASVTLPSGATSTDIVWSTSNSGIATVSDGKVTGLQAGSVIIRAKYKEDNSLVGMFRFTVRKTKSYIFFIDTPENSLSSNNKLYRTIIANKYYGGNTSYIETIDLKSATYFIQKWNAMGQDGFEIGYVIIECHARATSFGGMADENDSYIFNVSIDYYFQNKNMSGLITTGCNAGFIEEEDNLGVTLSKKVNGAPVIASDGSVRSYYDTEILESLNDDGFKDHLSYYYSDRTTNDGFMVFQQLKINDEIIPERTRTYKLNLLNTTLSELLSRLDRYN